VRLAPGNSGGPLTDVEGRVIGINSMVAGRLALAIPSNDVRRFLLGKAKKNWLGVSLTPVRLPHGSRQSFGLLVLGIELGSPAANASLLQGDILLGADEKEFHTSDDLADVLEQGNAEPLRVEFLRGDYRRVRKVSVALRQRERQAGAIAA